MKRIKYINNILSIIVIIFLTVFMVINLGCKKVESIPVQNDLSSLKESFTGEDITIYILKRETSNSMKLLIPEFTKETGINIEMKQFSYVDLLEKIKMEHTAKTGNIDIFYLSPGHIGLFSKNDYLLPLDNFIKKYNIDFSDFPTADYFIKYPGRDEILGMPYNSTTHLNIYRNDLFEDPNEKILFKAKYGYDLRPPGSMTEFLDVAEFFTRDLDGDGEIDFWGWARPHANRNSTYKNMLWYIWSFGGELYDETTYDVLLNSTENIEALKFAKKLSQFAPPVAFSEWSANEQDTLFREGKLAMVQHWQTYALKLLNPEYSPISHVTWIAPQPGKFIVGGGALAISRHSNNPEAAFLFLKWLTSKEVSTKWFLDHNGPVTRQSIFESDKVKKEKPDQYEAFRILVEAELTTTRSRPTIPEASELEPILFRAWLSIMNGTGTVEETLIEAHQEIEELFKKNNYYGSVK